jgi:protein-L-isoaspartate(D-aspartate) O-methyltransferase
VSIKETEFETARGVMLEEQIRGRGIVDQTLLQAIGSVPRHEFVPYVSRDEAYEDGPLPIGEGQTISQPYIVAYMTAALELIGNERALEIGTGCGYQAAVLSCLAKEVHSVEVHSELGQAARERLSRLGYGNVMVHIGDGSIGLAEYAPYDAILVAAAAPEIPEPLLQQLAEGGRMIVPVGREDTQTLLCVRRSHGDFVFKRGEACRFVPLLGRYGWRIF